MNTIQRLIRQLKAEGWTVQGIAAQFPVHKTTVHRWAAGMTPDYDYLVADKLRGLLKNDVPVNA